MQDVDQSPTGGSGNPDIPFPKVWPGERISPPPPPGSRGPRALPPTFVPLEVEQFPRPAAESCADNTNVVPVRNGQSIAEALATVTPGSTLLVDPGTYIENAGSYVALEWATDNVCLRAANGGTAVIQAASDQTYGVSTNADDTVIEGFTLRGFGTNVALWTTEGGTTQQNVTLERVRIENPRGYFIDGIVAYTGNQNVPGTPPAMDGLLLLDVVVSGADLGVSCNEGPCQHWWLENVTVTDRGGTGGSGADAFAIEDGRQIAVVNSSFGNAIADGIDTKASDVVVYGSYVHDVTRNGIKNWRGVDVINTVVDGTGADSAIVGDGAGRYRYLHLLVTRHDPAGTQYVAGWGYDTNPALQLEIVNSIFFDNASGGMYVPPSATVSMRRNVFGDPNSKLVDIGGYVYMTSELAAFEAAGYGSGNVVGDPLLVNRDAGDYSTQPGSPARDTGEVVTGLDIDYLGNPRRSGAGPDVGPVESQS